MSRAGRLYLAEPGPILRACWEETVPFEAFQFPDWQPTKLERDVIDGSLGTLHRLAANSDLTDDDGCISVGAMRQLGAAGYWGMSIQPQYGGAGSSFRALMELLTRISAVDPAVAGLGSVHHCIGAAALVEAFGDAEQKQRFLPDLARGDRLSAFAMTEPGAGTDLTSLATVARRAGDVYEVSGEKLFITNLTLGRTIACVCRIDGEPAVLLCELPAEENERFRLTRYGLHVLKRTLNHGLVLDRFPVPVENRLWPETGDGLTIAYYGLNRGRVALCALAAGRMRILLANLVPWCKSRWTYGTRIGDRQLVRRRLGRLAARIVACDMLVQWCANLLDRRYRSELECIIAKIFGSESLKFAAIEVFMKTHGGRSFLQGHLFGDDVHDYLAPCIYEGEGEMLSLAFFRGLTKGRTRSAKPHAEEAAKLGPSGPLGEYANRAGQSLRQTRRRIVETVDRYGAGLLEQQCLMADIAMQAQRCAVALCCAANGAQAPDPVIQLGAQVACRELLSHESGAASFDERGVAAAAALGQAVLDGEFSPIAGIEPQPLWMRP